MCFSKMFRKITRLTLSLAIALGLPVHLFGAGGPEPLTVDNPKVK